MHDKELHMASNMSGFVSAIIIAKNAQHLVVCLYSPWALT